jgi:hypothetical protein
MFEDSSCKITDSDLLQEIDGRGLDYEREFYKEVHDFIATGI